MDKLDFNRYVRELLSGVIAVTGGKNVTETGWDIWQNALCDIDCQTAVRVINDWPINHKAAPTPYDIVKLCRELDERRAQRAEMAANTETERRGSMRRAVQGAGIPIPRWCLDYLRWQRAKPLSPILHVFRLRFMHEHPELGRPLHTAQVAYLERFGKSRGDWKADDMTYLTQIYLHGLGLDSRKLSRPDPYAMGTPDEGQLIAAGMLGKTEEEINQEIVFHPEAA